MSKPELIQRIRELNQTARPDFLNAFTEHELDDYLRQLEHIDDPIRHARDQRAGHVQVCATDSPRAVHSAIR